MLWIVARKLIAPKSDPSESRCSDRIQRSWPWPSENTLADSGGYPYHPDLEAPYLAKKLRYRTTPPKRKSQYDSALSRGKATSRAPIINGTRKVANPAKIGTTTRKIIVVPWIVKSSL